MRVMFMLLAFGAALAWCAPAHAQTTPTLRLQWEMSGPMGPEGGPRPPFTVAMAQGYTYKLYRYNDPGSGLTLTGVACSTTNDAFVKTCTVNPVPTGYDTVGQTLDMTVIVATIESVHSNTAVVPPPLQPPGAPQNLRLIRTAMLATPRAVGALLHGLGFVRLGDRLRGQGVGRVYNRAPTEPAEQPVARFVVPPRD